MTEQSEARVVWQCPDCLRTFRLPRSRPQPVRCRQCAQRQAEEEPIEFAAAVPDRATERASNGSSVRPAVTTASLIQSASTDPATGLSSDTTSAQMAQVLDHLSDIRRTMKLFRRFIWGIGIALLLNIALMGLSLLYGMSLIGSLSSFVSGEAGSVPGQPGRIDVDRERLPPRLQQDLQAVEEYSNVLNELLQDSR